MSAKLRPSVVALFVLFIAPLIRADELDITTPDFKQLVKQLNAEKFSDRNAASDELRERGQAAFPALIEAAKSEVREVSTRAIEILKHHFKNGDAEAKDAAKVALEGLVAADHGATSRRAKQALKPDEEQNQVNPGIPGRIQIVPGARVQIQMQAGNNRRVQVRVANGAKDIEAEEDGRKVKIHEDRGGIKIEITEKKDGKETTKKYEAKNAAELKKQHPDAHQIYEKYSKGGIQIRGAALPQFQIPVFPGQPQNQAQGLEKSKQRIDDLIQRFKKKIENNEGNADGNRRMIEQLERHKGHLDDIQERLEKNRKQMEQNREELEKQKRRIEAELERNRPEA